jgi:hypothetical protein
MESSTSGEWLGALEMLAFFGIVQAVVLYDVIKTRREILRDRAAARRDRDGAARPTPRD